MSEINKGYLSNQAQRPLIVIKAMAGKEVSGVSPAELLKLVNISESTVKINASDVTRVLANLEAQQFIERLPSDDKRWRLSATLVQMANTVSLNFTQSIQQLQQDQGNYGLLYR